ncbi:hypothetical protein FYU45_25045 [Salmonella enterica subsp. diarizonae]|nr:hypothetical protein [Salmonella enterica subsp. diarizonae]ECQ1027444.1 hypothetical protein [Salmonella enterica subsp. diarizonae]EDE1925908.1 hypothetical protein [Salmonella enterica subsp. diarizonae]
MISDQGEHVLTNISSFEGRDIEADLVTVRVADNHATVTLKTQRLDRYPLEDGNVSIKDLKDTDGSLLGYYGTVRATSVEPDRDGTRDKRKYSLLNILYVVDEHKARLPVNNDVQYAGTFQYVKAKDSTIRNGNAVFHYKDKQINGSIIDDRGRASGHWIVDGDKTVDENGKFNIRLTSNVGAVASGEMQGGFYGSEGQVMAASAESQGASRDLDEWKGIFVGNQRSGPKS